MCSEAFEFWICPGFYPPALNYGKTCEKFYVASGVTVPFEIPALIIESTNWRARASLFQEDKN